MKRSDLLDDLREFLLTRRDLLRRSLNGELSMLGTDEDEESLDDEVYFVNAVSSSKELELIQSALQRFHNGSYGFCEECEKDIPSARLEALPCASLCIDCQRANEQQPRFLIESDADMRSNDSNQASF